MAKRESKAGSFPDAAWRQRFRRRLLRWFDNHARSLPWRPSPGLYETWISEIMLQQTQVATVIAYYQRFLEAFPTVEHLAAVEQQRVLLLWEGLGYYRRARQLHAAAQRIVERHGGQFPRAIDEVLELPGIGRYTAGAILSIALDQRHPILEANTIRVLSRLLVWRGDPRSQSGQQYLWAFAESLLPRRRVGDFNQALMELGSIVCVPREPRCAICPVRTLCPTQAQGLQNHIPRPKQKVAYTDVHEAAVVVRCGERLLLRRCQPGERWEGLWDFPRFAITPTEDGHLDGELRRGVLKLTGVKVAIDGHLATIRHGVTRYRITLQCHLANCARTDQSSEHLKWIRHGDVKDLPLSVTGRKIWKLLKSQAKA